MNDFPKVSVVTITYGHENYIAQTLDGVLMQDYPGEIELIIANDYSPDATDKVVKDYLSVMEIPTNFTIKYTRHEKNKGMMPNFIWAIGEASGKYIAICEGDDYWTDPYKLQMQVAFLEENKEYVLCYTNRDVLENGVLKITEPLCDNISFNKSEIPYIHVPTLTIVFRNVVAKIPSIMNNNLIDASLFLFLSQFGSFYYFNLKTAIYRMHKGGIYSGNSEIRNHSRSIAVRIAAFRYLNHIDKQSVADALIFWIRLRKNLELTEKRYISYFWSCCLDYYFSFYIYMQKQIIKL